jgi:putative transcriptional regulator
MFYNMFCKSDYERRAMPGITNHIRRLRFDKNEITQEDLAKAVGCTRQTIIALEQGKYVPSIELAFKIARVFNVKLDDVFQYEEDKRK